MTKTFSIYRSSAGSGKTRTLAKEYIKLALQWQPDYFKYILAVTFANKAAQEMKDRVILYLDEFSRGVTNNLTEEIRSELDFDAKRLQSKSADVLSSLLHHYSLFSISTIDSFFQKVIRSFTREAGLLGNFRLEVDNDLVLGEVIHELMDDLGEDERLTRWVVEFSRERLRDGDNWNVVNELKTFARQIFSEEFKTIEKEILQFHDDDRMNAFLQSMQKIVSHFEQQMKIQGQAALKILADNNITVDDFNNKDRGTAFKYFRNNAAGQSVDMTKTLEESLVNTEKWAKKKTPNTNRFLILVENQLKPHLNQMVEFERANQLDVQSAREILRNFYAFGLLAHITRKLKAYQEKNNLMLLSDAPQFLNGIINESDTPFIYEKVGSFYRNYLIDEFQDTSGFQWKNFLPLLKDSLDQGRPNFIVGDVKQSIYRWRGGDLQLLQSKVQDTIGEQTHVIPLNTNYRSADVIVQFNNTLFKESAAAVALLTAHEAPQQVFDDVMQHSVKYKDKGYVAVEFLERKDEEEDWEEKALKRLPFFIEQLQDKGVALKDIAVLVRKNEEGQRVASFLMQYKTSPLAKKEYRYDVVSNESLRLDYASSVNLIISALKYLDNPEDAVARGELAFEASKGKSLDAVFLNAARNSLPGLLPESFLLNFHWLRRLSVFELTEELVRMFDLGHRSDELAYLHAFQDLVLDFSAQEKNDVSSFLEWWEVNKSKKSVQVPGHVNAIRIFTIHKSKGLQFKHVLLPFCDWGLGHDIAPLLWVSSSKPPFNAMKHLAVLYSKQLEKTVFADAYFDERVKAHLDNLNVLYVALTRAEESMIIMAPEATKTPGISTVGKLLYNVITQSLALSPYFKRDTAAFQVGTLEKLSKEERVSSFATIPMNSYSTFDWREKLVIKQQGAEYFLPEPSAARNKINYGILLHRVLAHVKHKKQLKEALRILESANELSSDDVATIQPLLEKMMEHQVIGKWFDPSWKVKTEVTVLLPEGKQHRIDRVMEKGKEMVLVDYKTGKEKQRDREQIMEYAVLLTQMGYQNVQAYLWYLEELRIVEVVSKSGLNLF